MTWRAYICDTQTGVKKNRVRLASCPWQNILGPGASPGEAVLPFNDPANAALDLDDLLDPLRNTIVLDWDGTVVSAGIIDDTSDGYTSTTISQIDIWGFLARRLAIDFTAPHVEVTSQTYTAVDLGTVAKSIVVLATTGDADRNLALPITFPNDASGTITRTYYGYDMAFVTDRLQDIINEGPDIDFQPRWVSGKLNWLMRVGRAGTPQLNVGGPYEWRAGGSKPTVFGVTRQINGSKLANASYLVAEGNEVDTLTRSNADLASSYPAVQRVVANKQVRDPDQASDLAGADLAAFKHPTEQWAASIMADGPVSVADLQLGGTAKIWAQGHPRIPTGWHTHRIIGYSGDITTTSVDLQLQPGGS